MARVCSLKRYFGARLRHVESTLTDLQANKIVGVRKGVVSEDQPEKRGGLCQPDRKLADRKLAERKSADRKREKENRPENRAVKTASRSDKKELQNL